MSLELCSAPLLLLEDNVHLNRQRGLKQLFSELERVGKTDEALISFLSGESIRLSRQDAWEATQSGFLLACKLLTYSFDKDWSKTLIKRCHECLQDSEVRVRLAVSECLKSLSIALGIDIYVEFKEQLLAMITDNFERKEGTAQEVLQSELKKHGTDLMHDTEGWKFLETSLIALRKIIEGTDSSFVPHLTHNLLGVIFKALHHTNRFVREGGFFTVTALCSLCNSSEIFQGIAMEIAKQLSIGLADNWSQVRYAASVSTREFMKSVKDKETYFPLLLPRMCLNRYYVAEGVKLYSLDTWKEIIGRNGREYVATCMKETVAFYCNQAKANNHAVREAACHCTAELGLRMDPESVRPYVDDLLKALICCFKDASWPVRDAACTACGNFITAFPKESEGCIDELFSLWIEHLVDNIASVRDNSAIALGNYMRAYKGDAVARIQKILKDYLPRVKLQPKDSHLNQNIENTTTFGVAAKKLRDNDESLHSAKQQFSCGSLGPKLKRGGDKDFGFELGTEPWESTDGALYLLREYSELFPADPFVTSFFPLLVEISAIRSFAHYHFFLECLWNQLTKIAKNIGTRFDVDAMKMFVDPLFDSLQCGNRTAMSAAGFAISELRQQIGLSVFDALLSPSQLSLMSSTFISSQPASRMDGIVE